MALVDKHGKLIRFTIHPGNAAESPTLPPLLAGLEVGEVIADKAYDTNILRRVLDERGVVATIPSRSYRRVPFPLDEDSYRTRHLVENLFADLKQFRAIATRYCKLGNRYASFVSLAGWVLATRHL